jgi:glycosyltransferase involved in cell wall biosynthesis
MRHTTRSPIDRLDRRTLLLRDEDETWGAYVQALPAEGATARGERFGATSGSAGSVGVSLVIPAKNEARNIGWVLERVPDSVDEIILVDGDSTDDTVAVSRAIRPDLRVVRQARPGKGAALRAGFAAARGDVIVMIDADRSMDPAEIGRYLDRLDEGYDLVKGSRFMLDGGTTDMELLRRFGNAGLRGLANGLYGTRFTDLCYGFVAFRRDRLQRMALASDGFEIETEIVVRAVKSGLRIAEVPSFEAPRAFGESNLNTWRDGFRVLNTMLRHRMVRRPQPAGLEPVLEVEFEPVLEVALVA